MKVDILCSILHVGPKNYFFHQTWPNFCHVNLNIFRKVIVSFYILKRKKKSVSVVQTYCVHKFSNVSVKSRYLRICSRCFVQPGVSAKELLSAKDIDWVLIWFFNPARISPGGQFQLHNDESCAAGLFNHCSNPKQFFEQKTESNNLTKDRTGQLTAQAVEHIDFWAS